MLISLFLVFLLNFLFVPCGILKLAIRQLFYCTLNTQYRIVSYTYIILVNYAKSVKEFQGTLIRIFKPTYEH